MVEIVNAGPGHKGPNEPSQSVTNIVCPSEVQTRQCAWGTCRRKPKGRSGAVLVPSHRQVLCIQTSYVRCSRTQGLHACLGMQLLSSGPGALLRLASLLLGLRRLLLLRAAQLCSSCRPGRLLAPQLPPERIPARHSPPFHVVEHHLQEHGHV